MNKNYKVVIVESPYDNWENPKVREFFSKMVSVKLHGYRNDYPYGVMPLDTTDFISTHHFICELGPDSDLSVVAVYRTLSLRKCKMYPLVFPPLSLMQTLGLADHSKAVIDAISVCEKQGKDMSYTSSFAIVPAHRGNPEIREILKSIHISYHLENGIEMGMVGCVQRFKVERLFTVLGYSELSLSGRALAPVDVPFVFGEKTVFLFAENFSAEALSISKKYTDLWHSREQFGRRLLVAEDRKKAA